MSSQPLPVIIGSDHAAFQLKERIKAFLSERDITVEDVGASSEQSVDYPVFGHQVAQAVADGDKWPRGILLCGTGLGMSMVANRYPGVRAALCGDLFAATMSRQHNDANILVLGGRVTGEDLALAIVRVWLDTPYDGGRHQRRLDQFSHCPCNNLESASQD